MTQRFTFPFYFTLVFAAAGAAVRCWGLVAAIDELGLPVMSFPIYLYIALSALFLLVGLGLAIRSPGRSGNHIHLRYGPRSAICAVAAAVLILLGTLVEFGEALVSSPTFADPILCLLGLAGGICCLVTARLRIRESGRHPAPELLPVVYLIVKLMLNFKRWSTDPIILDYCVVLFALIFALLAFYHGAGFCLDLGKPRKTLFYAMAAVFFCAGGIADGLMDRKFSTAILCCGYLLWQLPVIWAMPVPTQPDPQPPKDEKKKRRDHRQART